MPEKLNTDVAIIGGGLAGLSLAIRLANQGIEVLIVSKKTLTEGSSLYAQGGIAAVLSDNDTYRSHIEDTLVAGDGICRKEAVEFVVKHGPSSIAWLIEQGVKFTREADDLGYGNYHLTREGGHSHRRIIHAADATGHAVEITLESQVREHPKIKLLESHIAIDLITSRSAEHSAARCVGFYAYDNTQRQAITIVAKKTVMATGGASKVYLYSSNPDTSTGDGMAMAWRAGCRMGNMEFNQFHPTCLFHPQAKSFLISEAVRGEGGILKLPDGSEFMSKYDSRKELAPRDIVARAIDSEMKRGGHEHVYLDISHKPDDFIKNHFPTIYTRCLEYGFDMTDGPVPVVPAAHYSCGGIVTDLDAQTDLENLYAIGECTYTGLHGANRLASNSLLECLVFSDAASRHIASTLNQTHLIETAIAPWDESRVTDADEIIVIAHNWDELRRAMWDYVGIVRTTKRLERALNRIVLLKTEIQEYYGNFRISNDLLELRNLVQVAELIVISALRRKESRGLHYCRDYPDADTEKLVIETLIEPENYRS
jgi:L-aspartate oxidase